MNAEPLHRRALDGRMRALGPTHELTIYSRQRLANTLSNLDRFVDAERLAATAAAEATESLGERRLTTLAAYDTRGRRSSVSVGPMKPSRFCAGN